MITIPHPDLSPADFKSRSGPSAINVAPVFLLPNINKIYLGGLWINDADIINNPILSIPGLGIPPASSSVEHLFIERAGNGEQVKFAVNAFVEGAKALKTFIVKDCEFNDFDNTVGILGEKHGGTLETLLFGDENGDTRGYRCSKFIPDEDLNHYNSVKTITIDMEDIRLGSMSMEVDGEEDNASSSDNEDESGNWELRSGNTGTHAGFVEYIQYCIPSCTEVLLLRMDIKWHRLRGGDFRSIASGIITLLESDILELEDLVHIYLDEVIDCCIDPTKPKVEYQQQATDPALARPYFEKTLEFCEERGIELHLDSGSTSRYIDEVCADLFDFELKFPPPSRSET
jgi:hypothetical protein